MRRERRPERKSPAVTPPPPSAALSQFTVGTRVDHKAFGMGVITSLKKTAGDALIEVDFEKTGPKKLMLRSAAQFMMKI